MRSAPMTYVALLRTPGGLLQKATVVADSMTCAHYAIQELWPGLRMVRLTKEGEW